MEKNIQTQFSDHILQEALSAYDTLPEQAQLLDGFESFIFNLNRPDGEFILRIGHDSRRSANLVQGESEFLNHLARGGLSVPRVLPSKNQNLVESIPAPESGAFLTTLFKKAPGYPPGSENWHPDLFRRMGQFMGKLHYLSKTFQPSQPQFKRFDIEADFQTMGDTGQAHLPEKDQAILDAYWNLVATLRTLPKNNQSYGLVHVDFHRGNFFVTNTGKITLFDFDDCQYAWFIYDIAMALFYALPHHCQSPKDLSQAKTFLTDFWAGYQQENGLDPSWLKKIPLFLRLRELDLYMLIHRSFDLDKLDSWCASFMTNRRERILQNVPYCPLAFHNLG